MLNIVVKRLNRAELVPALDLEGRFLQPYDLRGGGPAGAHSLDVPPFKPGNVQVQLL